MRVEVVSNSMRAAESTVDTVVVVAYKPRPPVIDLCDNCVYNLVSRVTFPMCNWISYITTQP